MIEEPWTGLPKDDNSAPAAAPMGAETGEIGRRPPYRFMTTLEWPDRPSFERGFYDPAVQSELRQNLALLNDPIFLIGEVLIAQDNEGRST
jgi:hypothetical protein